MECLILIPPSEKKSNDSIFDRIHNFNKITIDLIDNISKADPNKLYGLKNKALNEAIKINSEIYNSKTNFTINRYQGVVYKAINYETLINKDLFDKRVRITSALFGLLKPKDKIPNYKLKIDKLNSDKLWLIENSKKLKNKFVIDLLPKAHKKSVNYDNGIEVEFVLIKNETLNGTSKKMPAGHQGKHIKGRFVRWLIENNITDPKDFNKFTEDNYQWTGEYFLK